MPKTISLGHLRDTIAPYFANVEFNWELDVWFQDSELVMVLFCDQETAWTYVEDPDLFQDVVETLNWDQVKTFEDWVVHSSERLTSEWG